MSLKSNIAANYASQLFTTLVGIVLVPVYVRSMGSEAYGLVGFFSMLQAWFNLLDLGLTPTIAREAARFHGGAMSALDFRQLHRALSLIFVCLAVLGGGAILALADTITHQWLQVGQLPADQVATAVQIMGVCVALRWLGGLPRGVVSGAERLVWLSGFNAVIAALRFIGVLVSMQIWGPTPAVFFWHQLAVAVLEWTWLQQHSHGLLPQRRQLPQPIGWSFQPIRPLLRFALTIAFTSSVWVLVTQTDKLILSGILPLADYGHFTMAVLAASGITIVTAPISNALLPRMARLFAEGQQAELRRLYDGAAQLVCVVAGTLAVVLVACTEPLLYAWTGDHALTAATAPTLRLYAIGNGMLALGAFPYYLQYARGDLRYHLIGNIGLVVLLVPASALAATHAGAVGAGWVWVGMNALYLLAWVAYVHGRLMPGLHVPWLVRNVLGILLPTLLVGLVLGLAATEPSSRGQALASTVAIAAACLLVASLAAPWLRPGLQRAWRARLG